jgi:type IV pilus assembly protein PilV
MRAQTQHRLQSGFTLIEVLVALVVLSIGLLGIAKLVLFGVRANDSAYLRTQAVNLAYGVLDNMRANNTVAQAGGYNVALGPYAAPGQLCNAVAAPCGGPAVAAYDLYEWKQQLLASLPNGDGTVTTTVVPMPVGQLVTAVITVQWDDAVAQSTFNAAAPNTPVQITIESVL